MILVLTKKQGPYDGKFKGHVSYVKVKGTWIVCVCVFETTGIM